MTKIFHNLTINVFSNDRDGEDINQVKEKLIEISGLDLEKEKLKLAEQVATGLTENAIRIIDLKVTKSQHTKKIMKNVLGNLGKENVTSLLEQLDTRLDDKLNFFIRLDKKKLLEENKYELTDSGDCYHIKLSIAAYPAKDEIAKNILIEFFKKFLEE